MAVKELSPRERTVLLYSMRYPEHSDTELSKHSGVNLFTFNKLRNSLQERGLLRKLLVPSYGRLGFEIFTTYSGSNVEFMRSPSSRNIVKERMRPESPGKMFFSFLEAQQGLGMLVAEDFTALRRAEANKRKVQAELKIPTGDIAIRSLSIRDTEFKRFFDMYPLMTQEYGDGVTVGEVDANSEAQKSVEVPWEDFFSVKGGGHTSSLSDVESSLMDMMVTTPSAPDQMICEKLDLSRYKVRRIKDDLFGLGLLKSVHIPTLYDLGYEVMMFISLTFSPNMDVKKMMRDNWPRTMPNVIFMAIDDMNGIGMGVFPDLSTASRTHARFQRSLGEINLLEEDPLIQFFSIPNGLYRNWFKFQDPLITRGMWSLQDMGHS